MSEQEQELISLLTGQKFGTEHDSSYYLEKAKSQSLAYAQLTNGIAVLCDLQENTRYIYSGQFGRTLGLPEYAKKPDAAFEYEIFNNIPEEELLQRHILELRFFHYINTVPIENRMNYYATCLVHFQTQDGRKLPVLHCVHYLACQSNGSIRLGLGTYVPFPLTDGTMAGGIVDATTGQCVKPQLYEQYDRNMLSQRQLEILSLLSQGAGSKEIADRLCISVHTVNRHRQDILAKLNVANTAAAVKLALRMHII